MFIVADSGSTKTEWRIVENDKSARTIYTPGINPYYQTPDEIKQTVSALLTLIEPSMVESVFFYGAGCTGPEKTTVINDVLGELFPNAECESASDMLGACRGMAGREKGVIAIIGTGSNSCFFNGESIEKNVSPLGFILGDEGSGASMGKKLVADCLKNQLPELLKEMFFKEMNVTPAEIIESVYKKPFPNRYLAGISIFLKNHIDEPECYNIVHSAFTAFFERNIMQYDEVTEMGVSFVGSVAYHYSDILERVASEFGIPVNDIKSSPADGLVTYHNLQFEK